LKREKKIANRIYPKNSDCAIHTHKERRNEEEDEKASRKEKHIKQLSLKCGHLVSG